MKPLYETEPINPMKWKEWLKVYRGVGGKVTKENKDQLYKTWESIGKRKMFANDTYTVVLDDQPENAPDIFIADTLKGNVIYLSIKRNDKEPIHDWRDMQEIKNQLVGPEHWGYEIFPPEEFLMDTANQYHMWVVKNCGTPFGFIVPRNVGGDAGLFNQLSGRVAKQRPLEKEL